MNDDAQVWNTSHEEITLRLMPCRPDALRLRAPQRVE